MVATHDLSKDFPEHAEALKTLSQSDPDFKKLLLDYYELDRRIVDREEANGFQDEELNKMRQERVLLKDRIAQTLDRH